MLLKIVYPLLDYKCLRMHRALQQAFEFYKQEMNFGSAVVYAPKDGTKQEYEHIPESRYNHVVKAYSSGASAASYDPNDDGQVVLM